MVVVIWQLYWSDLEERSLISKFQIGYRPNHSTQQPTILLTDEIRFEANDKKIVGALLLDLSKVFDTISYSVMLSKLKTYGINNEELEWLASYLFYRSQVVDINKKRSNDLYYVHSDINVIEKVLNDEMSYLLHYLYQNELILNLKKGKTEAMAFGTAKRLSMTSECISIRYNGNIMNNATTYKYLGNQLDKNLSINENFEQGYRKASGRLHLLAKLRCHLI